MSPLGLGPFDLIKPIARGGMGEIWQAHHRGQSLPVAIKFLTNRRAREATYRAAFRREVQAVARLDHPNIVMVFDYGELPASTARRSEGRLEAGAPYLAMELVEGGNLSSVRGQLDWDPLREVLLNLLAALAHAHARGVIHRDIKPGNVLLSSSGIKLTDFGLAHPREPDHVPSDGQGARGGTPSFMAPEQFRGVWRDYGPWTDLYALGCLGWTLATGRPPFRGSSWVKTMHAHLTRDPPRFTPRRPMPTAFEGWLRRLLIRSPQQRPQRAADAAWALLELDDDIDPDAPLADTTGPSLIGQRTTLFWTASELPTATPESRPEPVSSSSPFPRPSLPHTWERDPAPPRGIRLVGAGLGLYGLRAVPMVAREAERDALWRALRTVGEQRRPRAVLLEGPVGCGKTRLAEWFTERAHEVGGASVIKVVFGPSGGPTEGIGPGLARYHRLAGLSPEALEAALIPAFKQAGITDAFEWQALTQVMAPEGPARVRFDSAAERHAVILRELRRQSIGRPLILWLEDVQWDTDSIILVQRLLRAEGRMEVLVVLTARSEALANRHQAREALRQLCEMPGAQRYDVGPLDPVHSSALVRDLLLLEHGLADQVEARVQGNPLFAVQLVGDWVQRGLLEPTERGFCLRPGAAVDLPDDLHQVWVAQVARVLDALDDPLAAAAIELMAALGPELIAREWRQLCPTANPDELAERLVEARLLRRTAHGWALMHSMLGDSLERAARASGRWAAHHLRCAQMLQQRGSHASTPGRLGRHLIEAGLLAEAAPLLLQGTRHHEARSEYRAALDLLDGYDRCIEGLTDSALGGLRGELARVRVYVATGRPHMAHMWAVQAVARARQLESDGVIVPEALRGELLRQHASALALRGDYDDAERACLAARALFQRLGDRRGEGAAVYGLGWVQQRRGRYDRAIEMLEEARDLLTDVDDPYLCAQVTHAAAVALRQCGDMQRAHELGSEALSCFEATGSRSGVALCLKLLSTVARIEGRLDEAQRHNTAALRRYEQIGDPLGQHRCLNGAAEIARYKGDLVAAERGYLAALALAQRLDSGDDVLPRINLALIALSRDDFAAARRDLEQLAEDLDSQGRRGLLGAAHTSLALCAVAEDRMGDFRAHFGMARALIDETGTADPDIAGPLERAAEWCERRRANDWAQACWELAMFQYKALGQQPAVTRIKQVLRERHGRGTPAPASRR